ncbi:hypothetical protein [Pollutimonas harenae]|uniref:Lipocalin-like domain-containing protein n=1 Tax=Pollutimonas harenae TaxID=657015 RepID=A0A853H0H1_9BURK|nr:hypothetical protein [Pollutimonas harenae]NYT84073.1 hypothetical protein [Pollutimonas harenae]TEA73502.1 hypothetical protein ERD84_06265 [Pollutimonas harenae]
MYIPILRQRTIYAGLLVAGLLAGCAAPSEPPAPKAEAPSCKAASNDALVGNWLSIRKQKGVAGELRTLFTLHADGTMAYTEQLKRNSKPSQGLSETGCWEHQQQTLTMRTLHSNGVLVNLEDPIYTNQYTIVSATNKVLSLKDTEGASMTARRMSPGYRLPF